MEMHQVRYFLAVARTLNFTRAADECNVTQPSLTRAIKQLEAELGIAAEIDASWDRLDTWPLFTEDFRLVVNADHRLAGQDSIELDDLRSEQLLSRGYCEHGSSFNAALREHGVDIDHCHEISSERDLIALLEAGIGIAVVPDTSRIPQTLKRTSVEGLDARRTVNLYGVAGRERTAVASAVMRMLRGADWRQFLEKSRAA